MTFHEAFWVVIGTAAPVVALAGVVSFADLSRQQVDADKTKRDLKDQAEAQGGADEFLKQASRRLDDLVFATTAVAFFLQLFNVVLQAALLAVSLLSINGQSNDVPALAAVVAAVLGLSILAVVGLMQIRFRGVLSLMQNVVRR